MASGLVLLILALITALPLMAAIRQQRPFWLFRADSVWPDVFGVVWLAAAIIGGSQTLTAILHPG